MGYSFDVFRAEKYEIPHFSGYRPAVGSTIFFIYPRIWFDNGPLDVLFFHIHPPSNNYIVSTKYIFVTGGVTSSLGKGIICASLGRLLTARGLNVTIQNLDPYIKCRPGYHESHEHGEVYVTDDGAETDLDSGHYERFSGPAHLPAKIM